MEHTPENGKKTLSPNDSPQNRYYPDNLNLVSFAIYTVLQLLMSPPFLF